MGSLYEVLQISPASSHADIKSAYRRRALATHPDKGGSAPAFRAVIEAFETLGDAVRRQAYDGQCLDTKGSLAAACTSSFATADTNARKRQTSEPCQSASHHKHRRQSRTKTTSFAQGDRTTGAGKGKTQDESDIHVCEEMVEGLLSQPESTWGDEISKLPEKQLHELVQLLRINQRTRSKNNDKSENGEDVEGRGEEDFETLLAICCDDIEQGPHTEGSSKKDGILQCGIIRRHTKNLQRKVSYRYQANISFQSMIITSQSSLNLDEVIGFHVVLVRLRELTLSIMGEDCSFVTALQKAVRHVRIENAETAIRLGFYARSSFVGPSRVQNAYSPLTNDVLTATAFWEEMQTLGKKIPMHDWQQAQKRMLDCVSDQRRKATLRANLFKALDSEARKRNNRRKKRWGAKIPDGIVVATLRATDDCVCAVFQLKDGSLRHGPLRHTLHGARSDLEELTSLQSRAGDAALCAELERRDIEAMTHFFLEEVSSPHA